MISSSAFAVCPQKSTCPVFQGRAANPGMNPITVLAYLVTIIQIPIGHPFPTCFWMTERTGFDPIGLVLTAEPMSTSIC